jgi:hypothetical protein
MWIMNIHQILAHLSSLTGYLPAVLITLAVAVLIASAVGCMCEPGEDNDDLFHHEVV